MPHTHRRDRWNLRIRGDVNVRRIPELPFGSFKLLPAVGKYALGGAAPKDYLVFGREQAPSSAYIAKAARLTGGRPCECVTEHLIARLGSLLPLRVIQARLVRLRRTRSGRSEVRFLSRDFLRHPADRLVHGVELMAQWLDVSKDEVVAAFSRREELQLYRCDYVLDALRCAAEFDEYPRLARAFGRMLGYDALIGANDRHPMNWGVIRDVTMHAPLRFAPVFDTARGLFWQHPDDHLRSVEERGDVEQHVEAYAEGSHALIGRPGDDDSSKLNHFDLVEGILLSRPEHLTDGMLEVVDRFSPVEAEQLLRREFSCILTPRRLRFIVRLLHYRHGRLRRLIDGR